MAKGKHPVPFRTRKLSPSAPMVLRGGPRGRVGRRRALPRKKKAAPQFWVERPFSFYGLAVRGASRTGQRHSARGPPERGHPSWVTLQVPVLVVEPVVLGDVEPHQPQGAVLAHVREQRRDLGRLARDRARGRLRQQDRLTGERADLADGGPEHAEERVPRAVEVAVDSDPRHVVRSRPPGVHRPGALLVSLQGPQPGYV